MLPVDLNLAVRLVAPTPVVLLSTRLDQKANVMPLSRYCVVSDNPPRVAISLAPCRFSRDLLRRAGDFALCVPDITMLEEVHYCGLYSGRHLDKIQVRDLPTSRARMVSPLLISNCVGVLECEVVSVSRHGDQYMYLADIVYAAADAEYWDGRWLPNAHLLSHLGADRYLVGERMVRPGKLREPRQIVHPPAELDDPWKPSPNYPPRDKSDQPFADW